jgi:hypothetical protein
MLPDPGFLSAKSRAYSDTRLHTLSDYPLLIGEILRRNEQRNLRRAKRKAFVQRISRGFRIQAQ